MTGGEEGITAPIFSRNTSHLLVDAVPLTPSLTTVDTEAGGEGLVAQCLLAV